MMKRKTVFVFLAIVFLVALAASCRKDDTILYNTSELGDVVGGKIVTDSGITFTVEEQTCEGDISSMDRVLVYCDILRKTSTKEYSVRVNQLYSVLKKESVKHSSLSEEEDEDLGSDGILLEEGWTNGKYLNLKVVIPFLEGSDKPHLLNLVHEDTISKGDTLFFSLRHNAYGETLKYTDKEKGSTNSSSVKWGWAYTSFPIEKYLPLGSATIPIKIEYPTFSIEGDTYIPDLKRASIKGSISR